MELCIPDCSSPRNRKAFSCSVTGYGEIHLGENDVSRRRVPRPARVRFILTGSSARSLRKRGVNLLAGRALTCTMHPLTRRELGSDFALSRVLDHGGLPGVTQEPSP